MIEWLEVHPLLSMVELQKVLAESQTSCDKRLPMFKSDFWSIHPY